jgi:hypothetical protein
MSKIVVFVDGRLAPTSLMALKQITNFSLSEIQQKISAELPFAEYDLFHNNHERVARILRELIDTFDRMSIEARFFEVREEANIMEMANRDIFQVSPEIVLNVLAATDRELLRQMDDLE